MPVSVSAANSTATPASAVSARDAIPLHQQDDIVLAKDLVTGEVVYIRTQPSQNQSSDLVMFVHDAQQALSSGSLTLLSDAPRAVAVPASEWGAAMTTSSTAATSSPVIRTLDSASLVRGAGSDQLAARAAPITRKTTRNLCPWNVGELENTPLINGDISFNQTKPEELTVSYPQATVAADLKQEPMEMGPPIFAPSRVLNISSDTVPGLSNNLPSGNIFYSGNLPSNSNLPSLSSLFNMGVLEGVRFDESGNLLSASVFEMVQPYIEKVEK